MIFLLNDRLLAFNSNDKIVRFWDITTDALLQTFKNYSNSIKSVAFSLNNRLLVFNFNNKITRLWDTATDTLHQTFKSHSNWVSLIIFLLDDRLLASNSNNNIVWFWNTTTNALQQTFNDHISWILSVIFLLDDSLLAFNFYDKTVRLWDMRTSVLQEILIINDVIFYLEFSLNSSYLSINLKSLNIRFTRDNFLFNSLFTNSKISLQSNNWIVLNHKQILWLFLMLNFLVEQ